MSVQVCPLASRKKEAGDGIFFFFDGSRCRMVMDILSDSGTAAAAEGKGLG